MSRIMSTTLAFTSLFSFFVDNVYSLALTDTITWGGDNSRTGYQTNHNMDPSIVGSDQFGQLFRTALPGNYNGAKEQMFSQPLVYTPADGIQYVYVSTTQNNIYKLNAKTGAIVASRSLHIPFLTADLDGCVDINPLVGITATGVIDPATDTLYLTAKTYLDQNGGAGAQGRPNGRYYLHAINVNDLSERANFPKDLEGTVARNNPIRSFGGGIHHQRPALLHTGNYIYAGFASHCVQYNFTGWIMGWDKTTGATVERYAMEGEGTSVTTKGGGVWMSGGGLASDDAGSIFFSSGNGYASQLATVPVNGRNPPTALEQAAIHMTIGSDGSLTVVDFFMPWEKQQLDGADKDLGTSPLQILPSSFSCGDIQRIGVVTGKSGKTYWLNLDDLGGYRNGPNMLDDVIQVYQNENSVYAGAGVYPLEGGYIYINVIQYPTHVFKFSCNAGVPAFTKVADSPTNNAYILGVGHGTVTSLNGQVGTGLVWTSDVENSNLRIYNAIPQNGLMTMIKSFNIPGTTKFTRPVFGDGRVYMGTTQGFVYGFGSPVNLPLNCSSPYDFGSSNLNTPSTPKTVTCIAAVAVTVSSIALTGNANFNISSVATTPLQVAAGGTFSFQATFNPQQVGPLSSDILVGTINGVAGYSTSTPISLRGNGQSVSPLLSVSPPVLAFQGVVTGADPGGVNQSAIFSNLGNSPLTISEIRYSLTSETGPWVAANTTSSGPRVGAFTFIGLPTVIAANSGVTFIVNFDTSVSGNFASYLSVVSNGGTKVFDTVGTSGEAPIALVQFQTQDGLGWIDYKPGSNFTFGNVTENTTRTLKMRVTNNGTGAKLSLTVSKPPFGVPGIIGANNQVDLAEGTSLGPGESATANLYCSVPKSQWNVDPYKGTAHWTMNVNDATFGKQDIPFDCLAVSEQSPPLESNGLGKYRYTGCFLENNPGRQLKTQLYGNDGNTISMCVDACNKAGVVFCGTQYNRECWGGPALPKLKVSEANCNYPCKGDLNQVCGGNGVGDGAGKGYISLFADSTRFDGNTTSPDPTAPTGPFVNPGVGGYTSIGCYTESTTGRALPNGVATDDTVAACVAGCSAKSYLYAGVEYGGECWCGNAFTAGAVPAPIAECSMPCNDNATEYCGAGGRLNVYQKGGSTSTSTSVTLSTTRSNSDSVSSSVSSTVPSSSSDITSSTTTSTSASTSSTSTSSSATPTPTGPSIKQTVGNYKYHGCWTEATDSRALKDKAYANDTMTLESCASFCSAYDMFGVEYARECYCSNTLQPGSVLATNQADCSFLCAGDKTTYCGAGNRLSVYTKNGTQRSSSGSSSTSSTTSLTLSSASSTTTSVTTSSSSSSTTSQTTTSGSSTTTSMSTTTTSTTSSSTTSASTTTTPTSSSTTSQSTSSSTTSSKAPTYTGPPVTSQGNVNFTYYSCVQEPSAGRLLSKQVENNGTYMTIDKCLGLCPQYKYAGVEYGRECWCDNTLNFAGNTGATAGKNVTDKDCSFTCPGNSSQFCGAGSRLNLYYFDVQKALKNSGN